MKEWSKSQKFQWVKWIGRQLIWQKENGFWYNKSEVKWKSFSRVQLFVTPWTVAWQALLSMEFFRPEYWSGLPLPFPGIEPTSPALQVDSFPSEPPGKSSHSVNVSPSSVCVWVLPDYLALWQNESLRYGPFLCMCVCIVVSDSLQFHGLAHQAPLSMEFSRQEYWSRLPFFTPGDLLHPRIKPVSLESPALAGGFLTIAPPWKPHFFKKVLFILLRY